jgi:hypothetical protein
MVGRGKYLDAGLAGPLKYLHQYRNEAYHSAKIRSNAAARARARCRSALFIVSGTGNI